MSIVYAVVARGKDVLAEWAVTSGTFSEITRRLLGKLQQSPGTRMSYTYDDHAFHYVMDETLIYLCMAEQSFGRRLPFAFLEDIKRRWLSAYGNRGASAPPMGMNRDFSKTLRTQMEYFNNNPESDKLRDVQGQIDGVKGVMQQNIEKVLQRGEKIELLVDKTEALETSTVEFRKSSNKLKWIMIMKNVKLGALLCCMISVVIVFIILFFCGGFSVPKCR